MKYRLGLFDSGIGGFTVLKRVFEKGIDASYIYLADNARIPYGNKSTEEIRLIAKEVVSWLRNQEISALIMACNTTNSLAFDIIQEEAGVPVFGLIDSAAKMINSSRVGVLATPATVASGSYKSEIESAHSGVLVFQQSCPDFVPLIEGEVVNYDQLRITAKKYLAPLLEHKVEEIVLGCTHYPLIKDLLRELVPSDIYLIDPAIGVANHLDAMLNGSGFASSKLSPLASTRICVTHDPIGFSLRAKDFWGFMPVIEMVSMRSKAYLF